MTLRDLDVDDGLIRKIANLMEETGLAEVELAEGDTRLRLARPTVATAIAAAPVAAALAAAPAAEQLSPTPSSDASHPGAVNSPMVGTVYLQPEPGAAPFVSVGATVKAGQTLLIIEAMKVMNPIQAPNAGTVRQILVNDAQPVEFGELLMIIE